MTDATITAVSGLHGIDAERAPNSVNCAHCPHCDKRDRHSFDAVCIAAPILALACLGLAIATSNFDAKLKHSGLTLMMVCMSAYVFHLHGRPIAQRPPVVFTPFVTLLIVGFCLGTFFCGMGISGPFGFAMQFVPTIAAIGIGGWLTSPAGMAKRADLAAR